MTPALLRYLDERGEWYAAGFLSEPHLPVVRRMALAMRRHLEHCQVAGWAGEALYPAGRYSLWDQGAALHFHYSYPFQFERERWATVLAGCADPDLLGELELAGEACEGYPDVLAVVPEEFRLGGNGFTHSIIDYGRVLASGLDSWSARVALLVASADRQRADLGLALQDVLAGLRTYHARSLACLRGSATSPGLDRLLAALTRVPWQPARTFYEGIVAVNWLYYVDGCDSLGRIDKVLSSLYERDRDAGSLAGDEASALLRLLWQNVDANDGWNVVVGGSDGHGAPTYGDLTCACLRAAVCMRRPNLALRVRRDMPDSAWSAALDTMASGCGLPALYNEEAYLETLATTGLVPDAADRADYAFGGCTETMVHGLSNVGSLDAGLNLVAILEGTLRRTLAAASSFEALLDSYQRDVAEAVAQLAAAVSEQQRLKAEWHPQLLRTLLIGDCVERAVEYNAGGARYNWSVVNVGGLANVVDSLAAVREVVFERREVTGEEMATALAANFSGREDLRARLGHCPRFGNDDPRADDLAADLSRHVFAEFARHTPWRGGRFLPGCLLFVTYAEAGRCVGATPDGRLSGMPIADSAGPVAGRDRRGPTAMMRSLARLDWRGAPGTLVVNLRLSHNCFTSTEARAKTRALIEAYFAMGNMQLQVNVIDQEVLRQAMADPEAHRDLIVRIGGYSEYFHRLTPDLQQSVLERTAHGV